MITTIELEALKAPFSLDQHEVREGLWTKSNKIRWFVYIKRPAVAERLDDVFPGEWHTGKPEIIIIPSDEPGAKFGALCSITIRGVTRWDGGEDGGDSSLKGALTTAFRRTAAYGWGIALYLYSIDLQIWTDGYEKGNWGAGQQRRKEAFAQFAAWYNKRFGAVSEILPQRPVTESAYNRQRMFSAIAQKKPGVKTATRNDLIINLEQRGAFQGMDFDECLKLVIDQLDNKTGSS
jgi:hypothetical protein